MDGPQQPNDARYSREEMDAILKRALERQERSPTASAKREAHRRGDRGGHPWW